MACAHGGLDRALIKINGVHNGCVGPAVANSSLAMEIEETAFVWAKFTVVGVTRQNTVDKDNFLQNCNIKPGYHNDL